jgi:hypothetical protein
VIQSEWTPPGQVVLDTNVFVAAGLNRGSHSARLIEQSAMGGCQVFAPLINSDEEGLINGARRI